MSNQISVPAPQVPSPFERTYVRGTFYMPDGTTEKHDLFQLDGAWYVRGSEEPRWRANRVVLDDGTVIKDRGL